jgi:hypothetical protein
MLTWDFMESWADNETFLFQTMLHKSFHAAQYRFISGVTLELTMLSDLMNSLEIWERVPAEADALIAALRAEGEERLAAARDALSIKAERRQSQSPHMIRTENVHKMLEGTAYFTADLMLGLNDMNERLSWVESGLEHVARNELGQQEQGLMAWRYWLGALYCLLLHEMGVDWQEEPAFDTDLAALLNQAIGGSP